MPQMSNIKEKLKLKLKGRGTGRGVTVKFSNHGNKKRKSLLGPFKYQIMMSPQLCIWTNLCHYPAVHVESITPYQSYPTYTLLSLVHVFFLENLKTNFRTNHMGLTRYMCTCPAFTNQEASWHALDSHWLTTSGTQLEKI